MKQALTIITLLCCLGFLISCDDEKICKLKVRNCLTGTMEVIYLDSLYKIGDTISLGYDKGVIIDKYCK